MELVFKARIICKMFFLVPSQKPVTRENWDKFLNNKIYSYTKKSHLALGNLPKLVFWSILSFKIEK